MYASMSEDPVVELCPDARTTDPQLTYRPTYLPAYLELGQEPAVNLGQLMHIVDGVASLEGHLYGEKTSVGR